MADISDIPKKGADDENQNIEMPISPITYSGDSNRDIVDEMEVCYLDYAMSVIVARALPDVRDGLKPVHRRILYAMHEKGLRPSAKYRKSATIVGDVIGKYHPHGDSAVYDAMVRMAQDFSLRYMLVDGHWNFGSMDGDAPAAYRYTEAKMQKISDYLLFDIEKETVDWGDNYDASTKEPSVLPTRIPNLLINGSVGIAVGMATNIPPHNLGEVLDALVFLLDHENPWWVTIEDLCSYIQGPDFPTGWILYNKKDLIQAYSTGRGSIVLRWVADIQKNKNGKQIILISEIPYQLNKSTFVEKIAELVKEKIILGVSDVRDESNKDSVRIVIELKRDAFAKKILNQLYKLTPLQTSFAFNMVTLFERGLQPRLANLKDILTEFLAHRTEVVERRVRYELGLAEARAHILEWLKKALDFIDKIIALIRSSESKEEALKNLQESFRFSQKQAQAILEMQLQKLAGLERKKIEDELEKKKVLILDLKDILEKPARIRTIIREEFEEIRQKFSDPRRTQIIPHAVGEFRATDTIPNEPMILTLSKHGYIKRMPSKLFRTQRRGGKGIITSTKESDEITTIFSTSMHNELLFFTDQGRVFSYPVYEIPESTRTAKGQAMVNFFQLQDNENISSVFDITTEKKTHLVLATQWWVIKRLEMNLLKNLRARGLKVMNIKNNDQLGWVRATDGSERICLVTKNWSFIQFDEDQVRAMGRQATGVRGIRLKENDYVIQMESIQSWDKYVFSVTQKWFGKISDLEDYRSQRRGGSGVKVGTVNEKTGNMMHIHILSENYQEEGTDVLLIARSGKTIRVPLKDIRTTGRITKGITLTKLNKKDVLLSANVVNHTSMLEEEEEEENPDKDQAWIQVQE